MPEFSDAPALQVSRWFNTPDPITLESLRGRVVALHAFQMLCPGCVAHGLPQARRLQQVFRDEKFAMIGLHTVFEHHQVMNDEDAFDRARRDLSGPLGLPLDAPASVVVDALVARTSLGPEDAHRAALAPVTTDDELVAVAALLARAREEITRGTRDHQPA